MVKTMKLLVPWYRYPPFSESGAGGGLSVAVWETTIELSRRGVRVDVLTPESSSETHEQLFGVRVVSSPLGEKFCMDKSLNRNEEQTLEEYDAILSVANYAAVALSSCKRTLPRISRQIHAVASDRSLSTYVSLTPGVSEYLKMSLARRRDNRNLRLLKGSRTLCVSEYIRSRMLTGREEPHDILCIPNGIETKNFRPLGVTKEQDLLFIGRFQKSKGLDILLDALGLLAARKDEIYKLAVIGSFSEEQRRYLLQSLPSVMKSAVVFLGPLKRDAVPLAINHSKVVVVPSRYESFGLPALEAVACGIPVLAARVGGLPEIIDSSVGALVEPNNPEALAKAISNSLRVPGMCESAQIAGPAKASRYDWSVVAPEIQQAIFA